jgi:diaminopimelate decarboxylase
MATADPLLETGALGYLSGELHCESVALSAIANEYGTPTYVYSKAELKRNAERFLNAARSLGGDCLICYAVKANGNPKLLRILSGLGLGADIVSGGELFLALKSGFDAQRIVFSGVGKTEREIREAISAGVLALHVESQGELALISRMAESLNQIASIAVRVNPNIKVETHAHVATGQKSHKFGVAPELSLDMIRTARQDPWLRPVGLSAHLGSQIKSVEPFEVVVQKLGRLADELSADGLQLDYLDIGGGLAIDYGQGAGPSVLDWLKTSSPNVLRRGYRLLVEPGRSIVGSAGFLLTRVLYTKDQAGQRIVITDAGMTDLIRPALYGAEHPIVPVFQSAGAEVTPVDIAGPVCESSDMLARGRSLPNLQPGDLLAILQAGAYGFAMSSNYNGRPRPAEVLAESARSCLIRRRESYASLLGDLGPD